GLLTSEIFIRIFDEKKSTYIKYIMIRLVVSFRPKILVNTNGWQTA
ncbi:MAG: hypothetical protein ACI8RD_014342, partial [Bacillariaceae sp.]